MYSYVFPKGCVGISAFRNFIAVCWQLLFLFLESINFVDLCSDVKFDVSYALVLDYSIAYVEVSVEAYCIVSNYDHVFFV